MEISEDIGGFEVFLEGEVGLGFDVLDDEEVFGGAVEGVGGEGLDFECGVFLLELLCAELEFEF